MKTKSDQVRVAWQELTAGKCRAVRIPSAETIVPTEGRLLFPGAFNPLHAGHLGMAKLAASLKATRVEFELSIENVDKTPVGSDELAIRIAQFEVGDHVWITKAAKFSEKAKLFPRSVFIVGADTIQRISNPLYAGSSDEATRYSICQIADHECRFLVFGRIGRQGFQSLSDLQLPDVLTNICEEVGASDFRVDISSTALRARPDN